MIPVSKWITMYTLRDAYVRYPPHENDQRQTKNIFDYCTVEFH